MPHHLLHLMLLLLSSIHEQFSTMEMSNPQLLAAGLQYHPKEIFMTMCHCPFGKKVIFVHTPMFRALQLVFPLHQNMAMGPLQCDLCTKNSREARVNFHFSVCKNAGGSATFLSTISLQIYSSTNPLAAVVLCVCPMGHTQDSI